MTCLHQRINQENLRERGEGVVEMLHSRWSSSSRVIADRPPSQPLSRRQVSEVPSSSSVKESHEDPCVGDAHRRESAVEQLQPSDSKWTSGSRVIADRPPLQPLSRRGSAVGKLQQSDSRWSSGCRAITFDTSSSQALARHLMLVEPSSVSALRHCSVEMKKNHDTFETKIRALCILNLSGKSQSIALSVNPSTGLQRGTIRSA
jgi:hypothetical protein